MGKFRKVYMNSFLFGEGMSGFVPSIAALAQGIGGNPACITLENGTSVIQQVTDQARFTTSDFFIFLLAMIILSLLAFLLLEYLPTARSERIGSTMPSGSNESVGDALHNTSPDAADEETISHEGSITPLLRKHQTIKYNIYLILSIQCFVCFLSNGALPSIQSYSCLPYGNTVYHLAVTLNAMVNPLMAFLASFVPCTSQRVVYILTVVGSFLSALIIYTALHSPEMIGTVEVGGTLVVLTWVVSSALFSYVRVSVAGMCQDSGWLFHYGALTQVGSAGGSLLMFILVNQVKVFQGYYVTC